MFVLLQCAFRGRRFRDGGTRRSFATDGPQRGGLKVELRPGNTISDKFVNTHHQRKIRPPVIQDSKISATTEIYYSHILFPGPYRYRCGHKDRETRDSCKPFTTTIYEIRTSFDHEGYCKTSQIEVQYLPLKLRVQSFKSMSGLFFLHYGVLTKGQSTKL